MASWVKRLPLAGIAAFCAVGVLASSRTSSQARTAAGSHCDADNGGLKLPEGFCARLVAEGLGTARHATVAPNGDLYVALRMGRGQATGAAGIVALRDSDGDGKMDMRETFGARGGTGIALRNGYLYVGTNTSVERYKMTADELKPSGAAEVIVSGLPGSGAHADKGIAFDGRGSLYLNVGAPSNACQPQDRRPNVAGQDPCALLDQHGGIWKFDENKLDQKQSDGTRYATGMRQMPAIAWHDGALYAAMNNRDSLDMLWPDRFTAKDNETRAAEPLYRVEPNSNFGWPYCFFDYTQKQLLLNPEYGGDGKAVGRCTQFTPPIAAFPAHWAPVDLMFYTGAQFPAKYRGGAFIAFHGSWNRSPAPQDGYNVTFQPFANGKPSGAFEVFADGFGGTTPVMNPNDAVARADGVAQAPDGSLYITDSQKGRVWRVFYRAAR
jgi:glucose/arabinose dehydrogenase